MTIPVKELLATFRRDKQNLFLLIPKESVANRHTLVFYRSKFIIPAKDAVKKTYT